MSEILSKFELRNRLKHIASLCWGLSIDVDNLIKDNVDLKSQLDGLESLYQSTVTDIENCRSTIKALRKKIASLSFNND